MSIEEYAVSVRQSGGGPSSRILLRGRVASAESTAWLYFEGLNATMVDRDYVGHAVPFGHGGRELKIQMEPSSYASVIDLLRNEDPVYLVYELRDSQNDPDSDRKVVESAMVGTMNEPVGEGPSEDD